MSNEQAGEKTEQATPKKLQDSFNQGQFAKSAEIQTLLVTAGGLGSLMMVGPEIWEQSAKIMTSILTDANSIDIKQEFMQSHISTSGTTFLKMVSPVVGASAAGGLIAGLSQTKLKLTTEAINLNWNKINPINGWKKIVSTNALVTAAFSSGKILILGSFLYFEARKAIQSPIFSSSVSIGDFIKFVSLTTASIFTKFIIVMIFFALVDYGYQLWKTGRDLMMTKEETKEEHKNQEGDPKMKGRRQQMRMALRQRRMIQDVPDADVILTNPTHYAVALKYNANGMTAPKVLAKGERLFAAKIKELAKEHKIPIIENKPLARSLYKSTPVGHEIPAAMYSAIAEILAAVYRLNPYKYHAQGKGA
ncbi:MAG: EscU/YscU/HrcU family type III secretion system export apparatus switch protein [Verrucomicrobia bacterium]|jgi:flagellar biosynthesis protein FlhB|nr:EscU/YscU/HrcU family type III secretion system export apparatus switch protein [Verrucomicrobiota bacterium]MBT5063787.1 EscU/YscU/HrcU family type III secretion system export apparatus switch protein [Verrucomicrobiota bacterium]MBT5477455.1 EscU/YscU/HrcU family type III secretion system export apparatus switch protein [Verrucomicrobiota bacterium]MBT6238420.1 EscU/YscU/HrcU family type III secretion system export apparatus switch protein [Verrucomicrobiota bacterium]